MLKFYKKNNNAGFTLIEVMVAVSIFATVVIIGIGSLITVNKAYDQSKAQRVVIDNVSFVLDSMAREIRTGGRYTDDSNPTAPGDFSVASTSEFSFESYDGEEIWYYLDDSDPLFPVIVKSIDGDLFVLTPASIKVQKLRFLIDEGDQANPRQPYVTIQITAEGSDSGQRSSVTMQTSVSQRLLNTAFLNN